MFFKNQFLERKYIDSFSSYESERVGFASVFLTKLADLDRISK
jgi:hypothetical protein